MAMADTPDTFESRLNQATDPNNTEDRWDSIQGFCQLVNQETDGPQVAVRLLAHKIQSPQEKESLQALTVLEACMNNCGKKFHSEVGKFRFLNELIKVVIPKYFGAWSPQKVKDRVIEVLYGWTLWLKDEAKIQEAYNMLKKQGFVKEDPKLPHALIMAPPPQRTTESVFDQGDKATLLDRLLKSGRREDLETANRLIKSTILEEQEKAEKVLKRESTLKEVEICTKQLRELMHQNSIAGSSSSPSDEMEELHKRCDHLRPNLFRLASDTMDDDGALAQVLAANDDLTLALNAYKDQLKRREFNSEKERSQVNEEVNGRNSAPTSPKEIKSYHLIDLSALDSPFESSPPRLHSSPEKAITPESDQYPTESGGKTLKRTQETSKSYYEELMQLNGDDQERNTEHNGDTGLLLRARGCGGKTTMSNGTSAWSAPRNQQFLGSGSTHNGETRPDTVSADTVYSQQLLKRMFVPVETIKSSQLEPFTLYDQAGVHVSLHFAKDAPPGHPSVAVMVVSTVNTSAVDVKDFVFQAAVPKAISLKLQPASGTHLPPYNPLLPPPSISQVVLLANPHKHSVRLRYKLMLTHGEQQLNETGEINNFPHWDALTGQCK